MSDGPVRTCIGCRARRSSAELIRLHLDRSDRLRASRAGPGRGAWVCAGDPAACLELALERRAVDRAFRRRVDPESVRAVVQALTDESSDRS